MAYVYSKHKALSPIPKLPRTKYTPYSAQPFKPEAFSERATFEPPSYWYYTPAHNEDKLLSDLDKSTMNGYLEKCMPSNVAIV